MKVNEIFGSIDGEGIRAGELATFIRLSGCNLRCAYCDTTYALTLNDGIEMSIDEILDKVNSIGYRNITLTGGEPLIHPDTYSLVTSLIAHGYFVNIETNGSVDITRYQLPNVIITADYKTNSSGCSSQMNTNNLSNLRNCDVLKFVLSAQDFPQVKHILHHYTPQCHIYFSPIFNSVQPCELVEFQKQLFDEGIDVSRIRTQLQLHKYIWPADQRGV